MPEVRLIDANTLKDKISNIKLRVKNPEMMAGLVEMKAAALREIENAPTIEAKPMQKPEMSEADRKRCEEWCKDCEHIEMCAWYPFGGCDFRLLPKPEQEVSEDAGSKTD